MKIEGLANKRVFNFDDIGRLLLGQSSLRRVNLSSRRGAPSGRDLAFGANRAVRQLPP
jgi:hypothetical protein